MARTDLLTISAPAFALTPEEIPELLLEPATTSTHVDVADTIDIGTDASADGDSISADDPVDEIGDVAGGTNIEDSGLVDGTEQMVDPTLSIR